MMGKFSASLYVGSNIEYLEDWVDDEDDLLTVVDIVDDLDGKTKTGRRTTV